MGVRARARARGWVRGFGMKRRTGLGVRYIVVGLILVVRVVLGFVVVRIN